MSASGEPVRVSTSIGVDRSLEDTASLEAIFAPVRSMTAFEETVERLGTAIRLGLLPPGTRLPAERDLCTKLGIARSTLRQALTALGESGHLHATRGRGGGTFVVDVLPPAPPPAAAVMDSWRELCDQRVSVEVGIAVLAARRSHASPARLESLEGLVDAMDDLLEDFAGYRALDVRLHIGLAELTGNARLVGAMTEVQGPLTSLITLIAHPVPVLESANAQHRRLLGAVRRGDESEAASMMIEHVSATEHVLAGLLRGG